MIEAVGRYCGKINGLMVTKPSKGEVVELRLSGDSSRLVDGKKYFITAYMDATYDRETGAVFRARLQSYEVAPEEAVEFASYKGVFRVNEAVGSTDDRSGKEIAFYRCDAFSPDLSKVELFGDSGWVTLAMSKAVSRVNHRAGDLVYARGRLYHKCKVIGGESCYELCVWVSEYYKLDGAEYWENVRAAHYRTSQRKHTK